MSERNKAILQQANAAIARGDHEGFLSHCTEETQWVFVGDRTLSGKEAVRQYMKEAYLEPPTFTVAQLIAEGDVVVALGEIRLKEPSGAYSQFAYCDVWRIRDGKLAELKAFVVPKT